MLMHHASWLISLQWLHDYDIELPNFTFCGEHKQMKMNFCFSFWAWKVFLGIQLRESSPKFDIASKLK